MPFPICMNGIISVCWLMCIYCIYWNNLHICVSIHKPHFLESRQTGHAQRRRLRNLPEPPSPAKKGWGVLNIDAPAGCVVNCELISNFNPDICLIYNLQYMILIDDIYILSLLQKLRMLRIIASVENQLVPGHNFKGPVAPNPVDVCTSRMLHMRHVQGLCCHPLYNLSCLTFYNGFGICTRWGSQTQSVRVKLLDEDQCYIDKC